MRIRIRGPAGSSILSLEDSATVDDLRHEITAKTDLKAFDIKMGYPPKDVDLDQFGGDLKITDTNTKFDGEQLIIRPKDIAAALQHPLTHANSPPNAKILTHLPTERSQPEQPASLPARAAQAAAPLSLSRKPTDVSQDPPELPLVSHSGTLILRVMPDDNSCLFRALSSAVLGTDLDSMYELRNMVASRIAAQPDLYNEAVLEKSPDDYCRWIQSEDSWGGAIELGILSQEFDVEVCSINVQDLRVDRFNEGRSRRCFLVYSGIHYDVLAVSPSEPPFTKADLPAEMDKKIFDSADDEVLTAALQLCQVLKERHYYTDTQGFEIKCNVCGWQGKGEKGATQHAKSTGHYDFGEAG